MVEELVCVSAKRHVGFRDLKRPAILLDRFRNMVQS